MTNSYKKHMNRVGGHHFAVWNGKGVSLINTPDGETIYHGEGPAHFTWNETCEYRVLWDFGWINYNNADYDYLQECYRIVAASNYPDLYSGELREGFIAPDGRYLVCD